MILSKHQVAHIAQKAAADALARSARKRENVPSLLNNLLSRIEGCRDTDCGVCHGIKADINALALALGINAADIMPAHLRDKGER